MDSGDEKNDEWDWSFEGLLDPRYAYQIQQQIRMLENKYEEMIIEQGDQLRLIGIQVNMV